MGLHKLDDGVLAGIALLLRLPGKGRLQVLLADVVADHVLTVLAVGGAVAAGEGRFGVGEPWAVVQGIAALLLLQHFAGNVDNLEPVQLLLVGPLADIHPQRVVQESLLGGGAQVVEVHHVEAACGRKDTGRDGRVDDVATDGDDPLLAVQHLEGVVGAADKVHDVQRELVHHRVDHGRLLLLIVDEFPLVLGTDIQAAGHGRDAARGVVFVVLGDQVADGKVHFIDDHKILHFLFGEACPLCPKGFAKSRIASAKTGLPLFLCFRRSMLQGTQSLWQNHLPATRVLNV